MSNTPIKSHEIDYQIHGAEAQFVEIELDPNESVIAEAGMMLFMDSNIRMDVILGDGSNKAGLWGGIKQVGKRMMTGESLFFTQFTNKGSTKQKVAFASPYPGTVVALDLKQLGGEFICQQDAFLCAAKGVSLNIAVQRKILTALFGGEGFVMQRLNGDGIAFIHAGGMLFKRQLRDGEVIRVDTGCLVGHQPSVKFDMQMVKGFKSMMFGKEGLFHIRLEGPGEVWLQSLPFSHFAGQITERVVENLSKKK